MDYSGKLETDDVLVVAGIDPEVMEYMTGAERREILSGHLVSNTQEN